MRKQAAKVLSIGGCLLFCAAVSARGTAPGLPGPSASPEKLDPGLHVTENGSSFLYGGPAHEEGPSGNLPRQSPAPFSASLSRELSGGVQVTPAGSELPLKMVPLSWPRAPGRIVGETLEYRVSEGCRVVYSFKGNGVKEDIVLDHPQPEALALDFRLDLGGPLDLRLDGRGNLLVYGPDPVLSGVVQVADDISADRLTKARQRAPKDSLLYIIPAPVVLDGAGARHTGKAFFALKGTTLTLRASGLAGLPAPVTIDPSIVVTTTADFKAGNDEGMISFDTDAISRALPSGGSIGAWTATTSFPTARSGHTSVAYNGYLYIIGGSSPGRLNDVQVAPINAGGTVGAWTATTSFPTARWYHTSVAYNGYLYVIGGVGSTGNLNDVQVAPINPNGTVGTWTTTTSFPTARNDHSSVAYNGYLYVIGGYGVGYLNDVQVAPLNANGTVGAWTATTSFPMARSGHASVAYNDHLYILGGSSPGRLNDVQVAPINADGTVGAWTATTGFPAARWYHTSEAYNGYLYIIGGVGGAGNLNDVQVAPINPNGTVGAWTTTTSFPVARYDHSSVAYNGYLYVIGGYGVGYLNDVQSTPINSAGVAGPWSSTTSFSTPRAYFASVAYNGYLYVLGGWNSSNIALNDVQVAPINSDGAVGAWSATTSFANARHGLTANAYNGFLYVVGGWSDVTGALNDVQFAPINGNGSLGTWSATTGFPGARQAHASEIYNGYLYVMGGYTPTGLVNDVRYAPINANGTVGIWGTASSFTAARNALTSACYDGRIYIIGGYNAGPLSDVQVATCNADGSLGLWAPATGLTTGRYYHAAAAHNGRLYVLGGTGASGNLNDVHLAAINADGSLGAWGATSSFTAARFGHCSAAANGFLYVLGGTPGYLNDVQFAPISSGGPVGAWSATTLFPTPRYEHTSLAYARHLYVLGGYNGSYLDDVQVAPINSDGTVGAWTAAARFSTPRSAHTAVAYNGFLYIIGGGAGNIFFNDVQFAPIQSNGLLGPWSATTSLPSARSAHTSVAYNGYLYVIGGYNGGALNEVLSAPINSDGTLGAWSATTGFPAVRWAHTSVAYNGYLYVSGGWNGNYFFNDVQVAPIGPSGTVGAWSATTSFSIARSWFASVAYNGYFYIIGGYSPPLLNDVQVAPINSSGTLGPWTATAGFPSPRSEFASATYNGYLYLTGGYSPGLLNDVQYATLAGPAARARYSRLVDIGSDQFVQSITFANSGAKGVTNLSYAVAPSATGVLGARTLISHAAPATLFTNGLNTCGRWIWASFDLDDTLSATADGGGLTGRGDVLDFTVNYGALSGIGNTLYGDKTASVHLRWAAAPGATSYSVQRCNASGGACTPSTVGNTANLFYDDAVIGDANAYWYAIVAVNGSCTAP